MLAAADHSVGYFSLVVHHSSSKDFSGSGTQP